MTTNLDHPAGHRATGAGSERPPARARVVGIDVEGEVPDLDLDGYEGALVVAFLGSRPVGEALLRVDELPTAPPGGRVPGPLLAATARAVLAPAFAAERVERLVRRRLGAERRPPGPRPTVTVAVCTRDREEYLGRCLSALALLDPAPDRVLVVDNASKRPSRALVERSGFDYVFEPRAGLNNARRRALAECATDLLIYTDDDCLPHPQWLAGLPWHFSDPMVGGSSGLGCPYTLESEEQVAFETAVGFTKGYRQRRVDWRSFPPVSGGNVGAGNNMAYRADLLREIDPFPRELDAGTPTASGGDLYALMRVLAAGRRVVYDPGQLVWHDHRADRRELRRVMRGYGRGIGAMLGRALVADREIAALGASGWPLHHLAAELVRLAGGRRRPVDLLGAVELVRGWAESPFTWRRALREQESTVRRPRRRAAAPAEEAPRREVPAGRPRPSAPEVSVIVPTMGTRGASLARCLAALEGQTLARERFEIILVVNGPRAREAAEPPEADVMVVRDEASLAAARNAGAEAARGGLLVFLDDDIIADPGGLEAYLELSREREALLLGPYPPARVGETLAEQMSARWWHDHFTRQARPGHRMTFTDIAGGWMAIPRELFGSLGGFDSAFDGRSRREDWEFSCRALAAGVLYVVAHGATARHHYEVTPARLWRDKVAEGYADVLLALRHPETYVDLHLSRLARPDQVGTTAWRAAVAAGRATLGPLTGPASRALEALEAIGARYRWLGVFRRLAGACYCLGVQRALDDGHALPAPTPVETVVDLASEEAPEVGVALGRVSLRWDGAELAGFTLPDGQWDGEAIVERVLADERVVRALGALATP